MRRRRRAAEQSRPDWGDLLRSPLDLDLLRSPQSRELGEQGDQGEQLVAGGWGYLLRSSQPGDWSGGAAHASTRRGWSGTVGRRARLAAAIGAWGGAARRGAAAARREARGRVGWVKRRR